MDVLVLVASILGGLGISASTVVAIVRWVLAHRPIRVEVTAKLDGQTVLFAVTNCRKTAEFEGRVTKARGLSEEFEWPWMLGWRQSSAVTQRIDKTRSALLEVAEAKWLLAARGHWSFAEPMSVQLSDPAGKLVRTISIPPGDDAFHMSWSGIELDIELSAVGHYGRRPVVTVRIKFVPDGAGSKQLNAEIIQRVSS
jgi:hypothetical protein